mmetsp:Transcript_19186/g.34740  ORF Transcript_19186/g.34740 Transcript_19186/m.34740 type:complete len:243 (+) Transcript_19186:718-1446(+)
MAWEVAAAGLLIGRSSTGDGGSHGHLSWARSWHEFRGDALSGSSLLEPSSCHPSTASSGLVYSARRVYACNAWRMEVVFVTLRVATMQPSALEDPTLKGHKFQASVLRTLPSTPTSTRCKLAWDGMPPASSTPTTMMAMAGANSSSGPAMLQWAMPALDHLRGWTSLVVAWPIQPLGLFPQKGLALTKATGSTLTTFHLVSSHHASYHSRMEWCACTIRAPLTSSLTCSHPTLPGVSQTLWR